MSLDSVVSSLAGSYYGCSAKPLPPTATARRSRCPAVARLRHCLSIRRRVLGAAAMSLDSIVNGLARAYHGYGAKPPPPTAATRRSRCPTVASFRHCLPVWRRVLGAAAMSVDSVVNGLAGGYYGCDAKPQPPTTTALRLS